METKVNFNVLDCIEKIYKHSADSHLREPLFELLKHDLENLSNYLGLSELQSLIFANCFILGYDDSQVVRIFRHFGMEEYSIIRYKKEVNVLFERKLLKKESRFDEKRMDFKIENSVISAISGNIKIGEEKKDVVSLSDVLEEFDAISDSFDGDRIAKYEFIDRTNELLIDNESLPIVKQIKKWKLTDFETYFFLDTLWDAIRKGDNNFNTSVHRTVEDFDKRKSESMRLFNNLLDGNTKLTTLNLVEFSKEKFRNQTDAKLSKHVIEFLKEHEKIELEYFEDENKKLLQHKNIPKKELFYNEGEISQIQILKNAIEENKFKELQSKLKEKAMPLGITVLLHGDPGTGKTESVYQIAKESGRNIFKVDISETKSMWFGESQKLVKRIFTNYEEFKKTEEKCPILLFNEADAVIGKRKSAGSSNVADTENAIQNILLEELEKFDGILFATTNLVENMDSAFERRFLFKVRFEKPNAENSAKIWKSKLPFLSESDCLKLTENFDFSGGEMENIARKSLMNEIVNGEKPTFESISEMCRGEKWSEKKEEKKIGF